MNPTIKARIEKIKNGEVPEGYKRTKAGIMPIDWCNVLEYRSKDVFKSISDKKHDGQLEVLSATQDKGIIPRRLVDIDIKYDNSNLGTYKKVLQGDFVISLRSFQGGIEYSDYTGIVSPAYTVIRSIKPIVSGYYKSYFKTEDFIKRLNIGTYGIRDGKQVSFDDFGDMVIHYPPIVEQQKIAEILATQDKVIELKENLLKEKQRQKKYLMQQLLTKKKRLPGFSGEWKTFKIVDFFQIIKRKNIEYCETVLTISAQYGLIKQEMFFNKNVAGDDKSNYYLLKNGEFAYNKSYSNDYPYGAIKRLDLYNKGIVSPLYLCLQIKNNQYSDYFIHYFESGILNRAFHSIVQEGARNHGILNVSSKDILDIQITIPSLEEQNAIAQILSTADKEIELIKKDIEQEKLKKKSLMHLLLTGIARVNEFAI